MKVKSLNPTMYFLLMLSSILLLTNCTKEEMPLDREQFLGAYAVVETCGQGTDSYELFILESRVDDQTVIINNLYGWEESMTATVEGDEIIIESQTISGGKFSGNGELKNNTLSIFYTITVDEGTDICSTTCMKR